MTRRDLRLPLTVGVLWAAFLAALILYAAPRVDYTLHRPILEYRTDGCVQSPLPGCVPSPYPGATKEGK